jgi:hypothetical protein
LLGLLTIHLESEREGGFAPKLSDVLLSLYFPILGSTFSFIGENLDKTAKKACWKVLKITQIC